MKTLTLSQVIEGYLLQAQAARLSANTIRNYSLVFRRLAEYLTGDPPFAAITSAQLTAFLADLATPRPLPGIAARPDQGLSKKTALNYHGALSALWTWAAQERIAPANLVATIARPRPEIRAITPFSQADIQALLTACGRSKSYSRPGKRDCDNLRPTAERDRAIILLLLDTGMRAAELLGLRIKDVDLKNRRCIVFGKGAKERLLPFSPPTGKALWRYLQTRDQPADTAPLIVTHDGSAMNDNALYQLVQSLGDRAGVLDSHPHRLRHTFAIQALRNGMNVYEIQAMLGHTTLEMVKRYLAIAQTDVDAAHKRASPVEGWRLGARS